MNLNNQITISKERTMCIKGISILLVILGHTNILDCSGAWGVHLFLILSGYGVSRSYKINGLENYWAKKIKKIWLPYVFCTLMFYVMRLLLSDQTSLLVFLISIFGLDFGLNLDPTMWYISYIFAYYAVFWVTKKIRNSKLSIIVGIVMITFIATAGYYSIIWHKGTIAWAYVFSFPFGVLLEEYGGKFNNLQRNILWLICLSCVLFVVLDYGKTHGGIEELAFTISAATAILIIVNLISIDKIPFFGKGLCFIGDVSYYMYLNERFVIQKFSFLKRYINSLFYIIVIFVVSFILAILMKRLWNKMETLIWNKQL